MDIVKQQHLKQQVIIINYISLKDSIINLNSFKDSFIHSFKVIEINITTIIIIIIIIDKKVTIIVTVKRQYLH